MTEYRLKNFGLAMGLESAMSKILSDSQLKRLSEHKYSAGGVSLLDPFMQPFWKWLVEQVPVWVAPNLLTIFGLVLNIVTTFLLIYYSPDAKSAIPGWALFIAALGLFIYQSLDAIDGKQARRTKSNTPLGELFDHGCDSVSMVFVTLGACMVLNLGNEMNLLLFENLVALFLFYCAHWQTYVSGTLRFGLIDVTEGQMSVILVYLVTALFGPNIWALKVPLLGVQVKMLPVAFSIFGFILQLKDNFTIIFMEGGIGKNKSTVAGTSTIFPLFPMAIVIGLAVMVAFKSPTHVYENHPSLYILVFGILIAKVTNRLVVAHMTKSEMDLWDSGMLGPAMLVVNQYFNSVISEYLILWLALVFVTVDVCRYSFTVCREICSFLGIYCFTITSKPPKQSKVPQLLSETPQTKGSN
ncbi:cholinephosphotransferase 1-like [Littorina saxatilis]|uniref:diacylglycerol cholinephosphotransferase n=1 Tax=Littorina saxatilis TaxID=31220 RepID=A0AAN9G7K4_9CAEN